MSVRVERTGPVSTVVLSRPEARNAVDGPTARALTTAFREFDADESASVAVLHGDGGTFCAGADLKALGTERGNEVADVGGADSASGSGSGSDTGTDGTGTGTGGDTEHDGPMGPTRLRLGKPVIAAIAGHAVAGGLELALWCDLRVAEEDAVLGVFCRRWGVPLIDGGTFRLPRLIGVSRAMDLVLTGRPVSAEEALAMGLVNRVVPTGTARAAAESLAASLAEFPQTCMRGDRLALLEQEGLTERDALANELRHGWRSLAADAGAGAARFASGAGRHGAF
ncbi:crotonase/enoyl-CoA hydratase family protein [Solihabitans fulvus]|uniref:Crotonase/enoyl-CoA hydratase family protein n=1 Tax=Solihabitans fulvus TaxID=1892852 RepID=A0A5B2WTI3_9PSEU|nr:crotonase/enoyl-CoA hydratase family protein [Solihabitans fulvus]KAA2254298.1 crotonase/enoyl-CoA hydratase family protein [Solihabitans fulvus]